MNSQSYINSHKVWGIIICILIFISACSRNSHQDIKEFINQVKNKKPLTLPPLPKFSPYKSFQYAAQHLRSPFAVAGSERINIAAYQKGPMPNLKRPKEPLESFALDSLNMVGTLSKEGTIFALIKDSHGLVYRVGIGNYIGQNFGQVEKITNTGLEVKEWLLDAKGEWYTRNIPLYFKKPAKPSGAIK